MQIDHRSFLGFVLVMQLLVYVVILLDIAIARQIILFFYLSFVPGMVLLRILKLDLNKIEAVLFSVGLSLVLLMLVGSLMNELYPLIGVKPLATLPMVITFSVVVGVLCAIDLRSNKELVSAINLTRRKLLICLPIFLLPLLSIVGAMYANISGSYLLLQILIVAISVAFILLVFSKGLLARVGAQELYPLAVFTIALALLFHTSLLSRYLVGYDVNIESHFAELTTVASYWDKTLPYDYNSMLSVTILPTIYSRLLNMDLTWVFKILYPVFFAFVPLGLYQIYQKKMGQTTAFLAIFFFLASSTFYDVEMVSLGRQMIAELFFVLLLYLLLFDEKIHSWKRNMLFIIFGLGLIVSHYSLSFLFAFFLLFAWIFSRVVRKDSTDRTGRLITLPFLLIFLTMLFSWYVYTSYSVTFTTFTGTIQSLANSFLTEFLNPASRGSQVSTVLAFGQSTSDLARIDSILNYVMIVLVSIGFIKLAVTRNRLGLGRDYFLLSTANMVTLLACIVVPNFGPTLNTERFYQITVLVLAPLSIIGGETFFGLLQHLSGKVKKRARNFAVGKRLYHLTYRIILISFVLLIFFLFESQLVYVLSGETYSAVTLSNTENKLAFYGAFSSTYDVFSAQWLSKNRDYLLTVYGDQVSTMRVLMSYGNCDPWAVQVLPEVASPGTQGYVYLRFFNLNEGKIISLGGAIWNISDISSTLKMDSLIYSNGGSDVYFSVVQTPP